MSESNRRPSHCKCGALPAELTAHDILNKKMWAQQGSNLRPFARQANALPLSHEPILVGTEGIEPPTIRI